MLWFGLIPAIYTRVHYHKPAVVMLVGYLTPEALVPQALLYNKTERGSLFLGQ